MRGLAIVSLSTVRQDSTAWGAYAGVEVSDFASKDVEQHGERGGALIARQSA
jgi:hypothetical protein